MEGTGKRQKGEELPNLVFLLRCVDHGDGHDVYGLHTDGVGGGDMVFKRLFNCNPSYPLTADIVVASDSKLCIVGGYSPYEGTDKWPRDFLMWDLTNWRNKDEGDFKCDRGPDTLGAKPYPCLFSLGEDIYALANLCFYKGATDIPDPPFEYYDSRSNCWNRLPPPPFKGYYGDPSRNCGIQHKLVGRNLYVTLGYLEAYSYDVDKRMWTTIRSDGQVAGGDFVVNNMITYCDWNRICKDDIDDDMVLFRCSDSIDVLACDFKANAKITHDGDGDGDVEMLDKSDSFVSSPLRTDDGDLDDRTLSDFETFSPYSSYQYSDSESDAPGTASPEVEVAYPYVPVTGLEEITKQVHRDSYSTNGFVAHLAGNIYCAVYFYQKSDDDHRRVLACKFEVNKDSGAADDTLDHSESKFIAKILSSTSIDTYRKWIFQSEWFKIRV